MEVLGVFSICILWSNDVTNHDSDLVKIFHLLYYGIT